MKKIAFVFTRAPHGNSIGKEGQDALIATSELTKKISIFFISDGIYQILDNQKPNDILLRDYITTFKIFKLYKIQNIYLCTDSLQERGFFKNSKWIIKPRFINSKQIKNEISYCKIIITF
ncbi:sulfurtransferase complex subunit TusC [Candidatus Providencia siddallii]|uniref:Protein TusC n=1 Tax=Candidatus Providencia siddallii TaxID=1715285 RepID=A0ABP1CDE4_9GAMM